MGDLFGIKRTCLFGLVWFFSCWMISVFMPEVISLSTIRSIASVGFAFACPTVHGVIGRYFPEGRWRSWTYAAMSGWGAIGAGVGYIASGYLGGVR